MGLTRGKNSLGCSGPTRGSTLRGLCGEDEERALLRWNRRGKPLKGVVAVDRVAEVDKTRALDEDADGAVVDATDKDGTRVVEEELGSETAESRGAWTV